MWKPKSNNKTLPTRLPLMEGQQNKIQGGADDEVPQGDRKVRGNVNTTKQQNPNRTLKSWETLVLNKPITYHRYLK